MASNFRILIHRNSCNLHLKLMGDFDGTSAHELIGAIASHGRGAEKIFIHTDGLREVAPFATALFQKNISQTGLPPKRFVITGEQISL
jgi:hypothetical protein